MKYLSYEEYITGFGGSTVPEDEFDYLAGAASDIVNVIITQPIREVDWVIKLATAYEIEVLYAQGGIDALGGLASVTSGITEKIGDYSISTPYVSNEKRCYSIGGIPVSGMTLAVLRKAGYLCRCVCEVEAE